MRQSYSSVKNFDGPPSHWLKGHTDWVSVSQTFTFFKKKRDQYPVSGTRECVKFKSGEADHFEPSDMSEVNYFSDHAWKIYIKWLSDVLSENKR